MQQLRNSQDIPNFMVKSTLGVALVSALIIAPFSMNNFVQGRYLLGSLTLAVTILCVVNAWFCYRGQYHKGLNLFGIAPAITIAIAFSIHQLGVVASYWAYIGTLAFYFILPGTLAWMSNVIFIVLLIPVAWNALDHLVAIRFSAVLIGTGFYAFISIREISRQHLMLKEQAVTDALTGLYNRSLFQVALKHATHQSERTNTPMTIIMFDLDHFKSVNDELGHVAGDAVLRDLGKFLRKYFRTSDMVFRIGGEEFLILLHNTGEREGLEVAEQLRQEIERLPLIPHRPVTVSMGVVSFQPRMNWEEWMKRCDEKLYRAKACGRNQVVG